MIGERKTGAAPGRQNGRGSRLPHRPVTVDEAVDVADARRLERRDHLFGDLELVGARGERAVQRQVVDGDCQLWGDGPLFDGRASGRGQRNR